MSYSERAYFDGDHCAHCAARDEFERLRRIAKRAREFERRTGGRAMRLEAQATARHALEELRQRADLTNPELAGLAALERLAAL